MTTIPRAEYFGLKGATNLLLIFNCNLGDLSLFWNARSRGWVHPTEQRVLFHFLIDKFKFVPRPCWEASMGSRHEVGSPPAAFITCRRLVERTLSVDDLAQLALSFTFICALRHQKVLLLFCFEYSGNLKSGPLFRNAYPSGRTHRTARWRGREGWKHKLAYSVQVKTYGD